MRTNLLNNLSKGMNFSLTRMCERLCEMWAAMSNHAIITQLSRNNHPIAHRCIRYATALLVVLMVGYGEMWGADTSMPTSGSYSNGATKYEFSNTAVTNSKIWIANRNTVTVDAQGWRPYTTGIVMQVGGATTLTFTVKSNTTSARTITGQAYAITDPFFNVWKNTTATSQTLEAYVIAVNAKAAGSRTTEEAAIAAVTAFSGITGNKDANKKLLVGENGAFSEATAHGSAISHDCPTTKGATNTFTVSLSASGKYLIYLTSSGGSVGITNIAIEATAEPRTFKSGEKIYFKDASGNLSFGYLWKVSSGDLFAEFYDDSENAVQVTALYCASGNSDKWNLANSVYRLVVPQLNSKDHEWTGVRFKRGSGETIWHTTQDQTPEIGRNLFKIKNEADGSGYWKGDWDRYAEDPALVGGFNNWDPDANVFSDYNSNIGATFINLEDGESYEFKVLVGESYCGNTGTITATTASMWHFDTDKNCTITADGTGEYMFKWNKSTYYLGAYYPDVRLTPNTIIYFDGSNSNSDRWKVANYDAGFSFKYYDSGSEQSCSYGETQVEDWVFYTTTPNNNYIGGVQILRANPSGHGTWNSSNAASATNRTSLGDNCVYLHSDNANWWDTWVPQWKTYCPPMSSASLSDNSTALVSWQTGTGAEDNPYLVAANGTIKVIASATKAVNDANMTPMYDFKVSDNGGDASSAQSGTGTTYDKGSLSTGHTYEISLDAWNSYNEANGTKNTSAAHKWYKAVTLRNVTHTINNVTCSEGRVGDNQAADNEPYTATFAAATGYDLPSSITVKFGNSTKTAGTDYTWNQATGVVSIPADKINGNVTIKFDGKAQKYDIIYKDKGNVDLSGAHNPVYPSQHTYGSETTLAKASKSGYVFEGWYTESDCSSGKVTSLGATAYTASPTLYANWVAMDLDALESGVLYKAEDMVTAGQVITTTQRYRAGVSESEMFNILGSGTSDASGGPMGAIDATSGEADATIDGTDFATTLNFKGNAASAGTSGSTLPTSRAIQFVISDAGQLDIYCNYPSKIYLIKSGSNTEQIDADGTSTAKITKAVTAGTYYLYARSSDAKLYGLKYTTTYSVTYSLNGGEYDGSSTAPTQAAVTSGTSITLPSLTPTKDGYVFASWKCSVGNTYHWESYTYTMTAANTTFTAQWVAAADMESGTLYTVDDIKPLSVNAALSSTGQYAKGISSNGVFTSIGNPLRTDNSDGTFEFKTETKQTVDEVDFTKHMWFKGASNVTSNVPTSRGLKFSVASAGTLSVYCTRGDRISLSDGTNTPVALTDNTSGNIIRRDVTISAAGTYYLLSTSNSNGIAGMKFVESTCDDVDAPTSLSCTAHTQTSLTFGWTKASNASGYTASLYSDSDCESLVSSEELSDVNTVTFSDLTVGTTYYCKVQSNGDGSTYCTIGGTTSAANGTTDACTSITPTWSYPFTTISKGITIIPTIGGNTGSGAVTYSSSASDYVEIQSDAPYMPYAKAAGSATVTASVAANGVYCSGSVTSPTITVVEDNNLTGLIKQSLNTGSVAWGTPSAPATSGTYASDITSTTVLAASGADGFGPSGNGNTKNGGQTAKILGMTTGDEAANSGNYMQLGFTVASGKQLNVTAIYIPVQPVSKDENNFKAVLTDGVTTITGTATDIPNGKLAYIQFPSYGSVSGDVTLTIYAWGWTEGYRFGKSIIIDGEIETVGHSVTYADGGADDGDVPEDDTLYDEGDEVTVLDNIDLEKTGHAFGGWTANVDLTIGEEEVEAGTTIAAGKTFEMPDEDVTLTAVWTPNTYDITYYLNDGSWASSAGASSYTYGVGYTLPTGADLTKTNYTFIGWYDNSSFAGSAITAIAADATGDKEYWAKWGTTRTIAWYVNGSTYTTGDPTTATCQELGITTMPTAPSALSCSDVFRGWSATNLAGNATNTTPSDLFTIAGDAPTIDANKTFYAVFANNAAVDATSFTTTFTSKAWADDDSKWTSGKDGYAKSATQGVQISTGVTGANATTKAEYKAVSKVVVTYSTNSGSGAGSIEIKVGGTTVSGDADVTKTGGTDDRTINYIPASSLDGKVKITVNTTDGSIYIKSVQIFHSGSFVNYRCVCPSVTVTPKLVTSGTPIFITSAAGKTVRSQDTLHISGSGFASSTTLTLKDLSPKFVLKSATNGDITTDASGAINADAFIFYNPGATTEDGLDKNSSFTITDGKADVEVDQALIGRHLPANFVIAAKSGDTWYALPADMVNTTPTPVEITVDNATTPTTGTAIYDNAYSLYGQHNTSVSAGNGQYVKLAMRGQSNLPLFGSTGTSLGKGGTATNIENDLSDDYWWLFKQTNTSITNAADAKYIVYSANNTTNHLKLWMAAGGAGNPKWGLYANGIEEIRLIPWVEKVFSITYNLDSGTNPVGAPTGFTTRSEDIDLPTPTRDDYVFQGWYTDDEFTSDRVYIIPSGSTGDKTYYAKWGSEVSVVWDIDAVDDKLYKGGGGHTVTAIVDDASWTGSASSLVLGASDGVILGTATTSTVDNKAQIEATFDITEDVEGDEIIFYLTAPANGSYGAIEASHDEDLDACPSGGSGTSYKIPVKSAVDDQGSGKTPRYLWVTSGTGWITWDSGSSSISSESSSYSGFSYRTKSGKQTLLIYSEKSSVKKIRIYVYGSNATTCNTVSTGTTYNSYSALTVSTDYTFNGSSIANKENGVVEVIFTTPLAANTYVQFGFSANALYYGVELETAGTSGVATSLSWSGGLADKGTVSGAGYSVGNADFSYTASVDKNSLGAITYSSSDPTVATVNAAGKVHMLKAGTTTIKAMIAESGCYNADTISYTLTVAAAACSDVAGTVTTENLGCEGIRMTVSGYTDGASIAWYKDGAAITPAETGTTYTATAAGEYYAVTTGSCSMASNSVIVEEAADDDINPVIFADEFSVKDDRWFGYRLMQLEEGQSVSVKTSPTGWTEDYHYYITTDADNIVHIEGNVAVASDANKTLTLTVSNNCSGTKDVNFTIHELTATAKPTVAWIATGTKGDKTSVSADQSTNTALYKFLKDSFDITPRNCYWSVSEADLIKEYSQYDLIILTDYPNSKKGPNGDGASKSYTNAIGLLIDHKPILTFEAFVAGCPNWGIATNPTNTTTTQTDLTLLCNAKDIFKDNTDKFAAGADVAVTTASSGQALQGFPVAYAPDFVFIGKITDSDSKQYVACCERQAESAARMMIFGLNSAIMSNMTDDGKKMVDGFLDYLYIMDPAQIPDCSVIFTGGGADDNWNTAGNWESGSVPSDPYVSVRIDAPCVIPDSYTANAGHVKIHQGGAFTGSLRIAPTGRLIVEKSVTRVEGDEYTVHKETQAGDIYIESGASGTGALIMKSYRGGNDATVEFYSLGRKNGSGKKIYQYMGTPFDLSEVQYNYYGAWMYRWDVVNQTWIKMKNGNPASTFLGYCISNPTTEDHYTYWMQGELVSTANKTLNMTYNGSRTENLLANSWTAPISINALNDGATFTNCEKTIYIFNAGSDAEYAEHASDAASATATSAGSYITLPISSTPYVGSELKVIPSMQAFSVFATGANPSLKLDYTKLVHAPAVAGNAAIVPTRAPRQSNAATDDPIVLRLRVNGDRFSDIVYMLEREDFTEGFDNGWDGRKMEGLDETPTLYAISADGNMAVNCVPEMEGTLLGFKAGEDDEYTFSFGYPEEEDDIYLLDVQTGIYTRIVDGNNYSFATSDKIADNRFILTRNAPGVATGVENAQGGDNLRDKALKFIYQDKMYIFIRGVLYDSGGRRVGEKMPYDDATEKGGAL